MVVNRFEPTAAPRRSPHRAAPSLPGVTATTRGAGSAAATADELSTLDDATALAEAHDVRPPPGLANYRLPGDNSPWRIVHPEGAMLETSTSAQGLRTARVRRGRPE